MGKSDYYLSPPLLFSPETIEYLFPMDVLFFICGPQLTELLLFI